MADVIMWVECSREQKVVNASVVIDAPLVTGTGGDQVEALDSLHHALMNFGHRVFQMAADVSKLMCEEKAGYVNYGTPIRAQSIGELSESQPTQGDGAAV